MLISPISAITQSSSNSTSKMSSANFKATDNVDVAQSSLAVDNTSRKIGMIGSTCLSAAVGLLSAGLTSCLVDGKAKPFAVGVLFASLIGFLSWPSKKNS